MKNQKNINKSASMTAAQAAANLTLRQLIALVEEKNTPKIAYVVADYQDKSYHFKVFSDGKIQADVAGRLVAFRFTDCGSYTYPDYNRKKALDNATPTHIPAEQFMDLKWSIRIALEAEDRLNKKRQNYERRNCSCRY